MLSCSTTRSRNPALTTFTRHGISTGRQRSDIVRLDQHPAATHRHPPDTTLALRHIPEASRRLTTHSSTQGLGYLAAEMHCSLMRSAHTRTSVSSTSPTGRCVWDTSRSGPSPQRGNQRRPDALRDNASTPPSASETAASILSSLSIRIYFWQYSDMPLTRRGHRSLP